MTSLGRTTIRDVAERTGFSITTVSHVLNDVPGKRISSATRERIQRVATDLAYRPNGVAKGLRQKRTNTIGFLSDQIATTPHAGRLIQGAQDTAATRGYLLISLDYSGHEELRERQVRVLLDRQVDGIIYAAMYHQVITLPAESAQTPAVLLNAQAADDRHHSVVPDEYGGAVNAVRELVDHGHRRIGYLNDVAATPAAEPRLNGYRTVLQEAGISTRSSWIVTETADTNGGYRAATDLLADPDRPTAVFCFNDRMAMGVYQAAADLNLRIPHDISVVGFDNQELIAGDLRPGLTTVALPHYDMGAWAVNTLIDSLSGGDDAPPVQATLACPTVRRESVGPPSRE